MIETTPRITTGEAAEIVHVHESTVKRWCDAGDLEVELTQGGHRRITLRSLLKYAAANDLKCGLLAFGVDAERAYGALVRARSSDFDRTSRMLYRTVKIGDSEAAARLMLYLINKGLDVSTVLDQGVAPVLRAIGRKWAAGTLPVGEEHRMTYVIVDALYHVRNSLSPGNSNESRAVVGCLAGNRHDIGANMVRITLESRGWEVIYLGGDVPTQDFAHQQERTQSTLVCISLTAPQVAADARRVVRSLAKIQKTNGSLRVAVGGAPVHGLAPDSFRDLPFADCRPFSTLISFSQWL